MTAVGLPTIGALVAAVLIGGFGWLLLEVPHEVGIWLFGGVAAVILVAATII
ncbi:MAG: YeeE/YedE family protein, partial [Actinobacteria bacterium]|nr:YeeE/YedE family protein [Actinomycetota bacterium]NIU66708.1 YeeE/YedE family protein [Actinomycetota bacterium]NIW28509.1 YeeE/YedE family protein [Actinomycetota bacterium]